jgi:hypothetical protein
LIGAEVMKHSSDINPINSRFSTIDSPRSTA